MTISLSKLLVRLVRYFRKQRGDFISYGNLEIWQRNGFSIIPNHYYSPIPDLALLGTKVFTNESRLTGVKMQIEKQKFFLKKLSKYDSELKDFATLTREVDGQCDPKFYFGNMAYDNLDACIYYSIVRHLKPKLVIEVGSGWSTKIAAAAVLKNNETKLVSIEPYPQPILKKGFSGFTKLIEKKIEDVPLSFFSNLGKGDILFVDSSHTVKTGGDVNYLFLEILPRLKKGVWVHVHDIFLPWEYPQKWVRQEYRFWSEQYLLQSFLIYNSHFEVVIANNLLANKQGRLIRSLFPSLKDVGGGSFWIRKIK
jgi:hypothetical protein